MARSKDNIEDKIPFVHSLLEAIGESSMTKEQICQKYKGYRPGDKKAKPVAMTSDDLRKVEVYLLTLADNFYIKQDVASWGNSGKVSQFVYSIDRKGRDFLNNKK